MKKDEIWKARDFIAPLGSLILYFIFYLLNVDILRSIFGSVLVLYAPGAAFMKFIFTKEEEIEWLERIVLSIALSIFFIAFSGLFFNYARFGITFSTGIFSISFFTLLFLALAYLKIRKQSLANKVE